MKALELILNILTIPIKIFLFLPVGIVFILAAIAGYADDSIDILGSCIFEKWIDFDRW